MTNALVIDDEAQIRRLRRVSLEKQGFSVLEAATGEDGVQLALGRKPDIVLLDLGLPDVDGAAVLARLRSWSSVPVVVLTVRNTEEDIVRLLDGGADDYVVKPFNTGELVARMRAALRHRTPQEKPEPIVSGRLSVDLIHREVRVASEPVRLTPTEYAVLRLFAQHPGRVLTHGQILREVWGAHRDDDTDVLRVYVTALRRKIEEVPQMPELIITEPGVGYRLQVLPPRS